MCGDCHDRREIGNRIYRENLQKALHAVYEAQADFHALLIEGIRLEVIPIDRAISLRNDIYEQKEKARAMLLDMGLPEV